MKYLLIFVLALGGGFLGSIAGQHVPNFGATTARTTITNPWTFQATTTLANIIITSTNAATSTAQVGCIQTTATSTATPIRLEFSTTTGNAAYPSGMAVAGLVAWKYGYCPKLP